MCRAEYKQDPVSYYQCRENFNANQIRHDAQLDTELRVYDSCAPTFKIKKTFSANEEKLLLKIEA